MLRKYLGMALSAIGVSSARVYKGESTVAFELPSFEFKRKATLPSFNRISQKKRRLYARRLNKHK